MSTRVSCDINSNFEMSNATVACTGCRGFNDSVSLLRDLDRHESPWCVHILSMMKAYECILTAQESSERDTVTPADMFSLSTFQIFVRRSYNDQRTCVLIRTWGGKSSYLVLAPLSHAYAENVPQNSICIIRNISTTLRLISCSNVTCRKGKNKKIKKDKVASHTCCHLRHLLESISSTADQSISTELGNSDDSETDSCEDEGRKCSQLPDMNTFKISDSLFLCRTKS